MDPGSTIHALISSVGSGRVCRCSARINGPERTRARPRKNPESDERLFAGQKSLSAKFDSDIEIITPELQKIQFTSSGEMKMNRPDKLRIRRTGGYADVELVYDGKTISLYGNNAKSYVQADLAGTVDQMIDTL